MKDYLFLITLFAFTLTAGFQYGKRTLGNRISSLCWNEQNLFKLRGTLYVCIPAEVVSKYCDGGCGDKSEGGE